VDDPSPPSRDIVVLSRLSKREVEVLKYIADGLSTKQIAVEMDITFKTAVSHRSHLMEKLNIHSAVILTRYAIRVGLVQP
jgi:DNA-binding NarL/FixJ family response regulator